VSEEYVDKPCECPAAGWCARNRQVMVTAQHSLCRTDKRYRELFARMAEELDPNPPSGYHEPDEPRWTRRVGVGDLVAAGLKKIGLKPCGACNKRRKALNRFSVNVPAFIAPEPQTEYIDSSPPTDWGKPDARWAVAVTTAPRKPATLERSLRSLAAAGFTDVRVFAEPGSTVPKWDVVAVHERTLGPFQNWRTSLAALRDEKPDAEFYAVFQDDVLYSRGLKEFLESDLWFADDIGFVSPYRSEGKKVKGRFIASEKYMDRREPLRERCRLGNGLWGALTYVMPRASVDVLLADEALKIRERTIDLAIHPTLAAKGLRAWYYNPSLAEHMKGASSLDHGQGRGMNSGKTFRGEEFDCLSLLEGVAA
jgi:hypothetical protein